jgi:hypothetical protein
MESKFSKIQTGWLQQVHDWGFILLNFYDVQTEMIVRNGK